MPEEGGKRNFVSYTFPGDLGKGGVATMTNYESVMLLLTVASLCIGIVGIMR